MAIHGAGAQSGIQRARGHACTVSIGATFLSRADKRKARDRMWPRDNPCVGQGWPTSAPGAIL